MWHEVDLTYGLYVEGMLLPIVSPLSPHYCLIFILVTLRRTVAWEQLGNFKRAHIFLLNQSTLEEKMSSYSMPPALPPGID